MFFFAHRNLTFRLFSSQIQLLLKHKKNPKKHHKMDEMSETKMSEPRCPAVLVRKDRRRFSFCLFPQLSFFSPYHLFSSSLFSYQRYVQSHLAWLFSLQCNIPLKVTAIVSRSRTTRNNKSFSVWLRNISFLSHTVSVALRVDITLFLSEWEFDLFLDRKWWR